MDLRIAGADLWSARLLGVVGGQVSSDDIESWVDASWADGQLVHALPREFLDRLPRRGRLVSRYGDSGILRSEVCFEHARGPGGVIVRTPAMKVWTRSRAPYCVAPHVHKNAHLTVVLQGAAHFFIAHCEEGDPHVVQVTARPGDLLVCPGGLAHTFGSTGVAFTVLSVQARFVDPSRADFACNVGTFDGLRFVQRAAGDPIRPLDAAKNSPRRSVASRACRCPSATDPPRP